MGALRQCNSTPTPKPRLGSHLVAFDPRPQAKIEDDGHAEAEKLSGDAPEFAFDLGVRRRVPGAGAKGPEPFILREAYRAPVRG